MAQGDPGDPRDPGARYAPRKILVRLWTDDDSSPFSVGGPDEDWRNAPRPGSIRDIAETLIADRTSGRVLHRFWFVPGLEVWEVPHGEEITRATAVAEVPWVKYAQLDHLGHLAAPANPNDPAYQAGYQWGLDRVCIAAAWGVVQKTYEFPIAIIDSGVNYLHPQLSKNILVNSANPLPVNGVDNDDNGFVDDYWGTNVVTHGVPCPAAIACDQTCEGDPMDLDGHGSGVAAVAGAVTDDCRSIAGAAWACSLIPIKIQADTNIPCGYIGITDTSILLAFQYAVQRGAKIANCSWNHEDTLAQFEAFKALDVHGIVAVVAAGNFCCDIDASAPFCDGAYPSRYTFANMIVVGASNPSDNPWTVPPPASLECGSSYGNLSVDLFAPGENIRVLSLGDSPTSCTATATGTYQTGTSYAAPLVSGVAALVWAANPTFTAHDVVTRLRSTARPVTALGNLCVSGGVLDASAALGVGPCLP